MIEHPLLFTGEMVGRILDGGMTQTRRVHVGRYRNWKVGDTIWVREAFGINRKTGNLYYRADNPEGTHSGLVYKWNPSIHMFRKYARIFLEITGLRDERVQDIDAVEAEAEGVRRPKRLCPDRHDEYILERFQRLWDSINAKRHNGIYAWPKNPVVKVIEFKKEVTCKNQNRTA